MRVKQKNLFYEFLPSKKDKKKLMAEQGAAVGNGPVDPRIKNMVKTLPDNYFDIFGTQPKAQPPGIVDVGAQGPQPITAPAPMGTPHADPGSYNPGIQPKMNHGMNWGNAALETLLGVDAIMPHQRIHNQRVIRPERGVEGYQPYPYGTGSQALADGGPIQQGPRKPIYVSDPKDPRIKRYSDSLRNYDQSGLLKKDLIGKGWKREKQMSNEEEDRATYGQLHDPNGKPPSSWDMFTRKNTTGANDQYYVGNYSRPVQPYEYQAKKKYTPKQLEDIKSGKTPVQDQRYSRGDMHGISRKYMLPSEEAMWRQRGEIKPAGNIGPLAGGKTNFSFTGRDQGGQQVTRYFPDMDSWQDAANMLGYSHSEVDSQGAHATGIGNQFDDGGYMMDVERQLPIIIPEGVADNTPMAKRGFQIPIARTLQYENLPEAAGGYQIKNDVVHMKELPTQRQMENKMEKAKDGKWIQKAVNPKHKGYCTPMTKKTCTPRRKALAKTFKKHHGFHKKEDGGLLEALMAYGGIIPDNMSNFSPHEYEYGGTARGGSDTMFMLENMVWHPSSEDMQGYAMGGSMGGGMSHGGGHFSGSHLGLYGVGDNESPYPKKRRKTQNSYENGGTKGQNEVSIDEKRVPTITHGRRKGDSRYTPNPPTYNMLNVADPRSPVMTSRDSAAYREYYNRMRNHPNETMLDYFWLNQHVDDIKNENVQANNYNKITAYEDALAPGTMSLYLPKDIKKRYGGSMRGGSDTTDMLENIFFHPSSADMRGWDSAKRGKTLTRSKAREILHDGTAQGYPLTEKQRKYFGAVASGYAAAGLPIPGGGPGNLDQMVGLADRVNQVLSSGNSARDIPKEYGSDERALLQDAYVWRQQNMGRNPEQIIQGYYGRPSDGNVGQLRQRLSSMNPSSLYHTSPIMNSQQRQGSTAGLDQRKEPILHFDQGGVMYDDGGNVETMWGGNVNLKAYNPYDGGTMEFNGASHENGGIGMHYNGNPVEVEGGETASRDSQGNLNIYGNMYLPGTRTKFKSVAKEIAEKEKRYDGLRARGAELVNNSNPADKFSKLAFNSGRAMMTGGTMGQMDLAEKKENLAHLQRAMLDTADEYGLDAQEMSKGNIKQDKRKKKQAKGGTYIPFAQDGLTTDDQQDPNDPTRADRNKNPGNIKYNNWAKAHGAVGQDKDGFAIFQDRGTGELAMKSLLQSKGYNNMSVKDAIHKWTGGHPYRHDLGNLEGKRVGDLSQEEFDKVVGTMQQGEGTRYGTVRAKVPVKPLPTRPANPQIPYTPIRLPNVPLTPDAKRPTPPGVNPPPLGEIPIPQRPNLPTNAQPLQLEEILPELYAAATNRVEPVPMQQYRPELYTPYQVSFQDRLNQNQSSFNALQRTLGVTNPNALGALAAQKYAADSSVKADEFRTNQAISNDITNRNIALSNDAQLKNLAIADTQYDRQEGARAKTREYNQMILNSLSSKYAQNKLENNRLKVYENLYDYRFMPTEQGGLQATYMGPNAMFNFNQTPVNKQNAQDVRTVSQYDRNGNLKGYRTYDDSALKEAKDAIMLEEQRRKLPLLSVPPL